MADITFARGVTFSDGICFAQPDIAQDGEWPAHPCSLTVSDKIALLARAIAVAVPGTSAELKAALVSLASEVRE